MRIFKSAVVAFIVASISTGCLMGNPKEADPDSQPGVAMGDKAEAFGGDWSKFIVGRWSPYSGASIDPALAKQMGVESVNGGGEVDVDRWWTFKADGSFTFRRRAFSQIVQGTWVAQPDGAKLTYVSLDGVPMAQAQAKVKETAESGRQGAIVNDMAMEFVFDTLPTLNQLKLDEDKKHMYFAGQGEPDPGMGNLGALSRTSLERVADAP